MNKKTLTIGIVGIVVILGAVLLQSKSSVKLGSQTATQIINQTASATSTYEWILTSATASSTLDGRVVNASSADVKVCAVASSSVAYLDYSIWFSNDTSAATRTWYKWTTADGGTGTVTNSNLLGSLSLATSSEVTNYKCQTILITPITDDFMRVKYSVRGANAGVHVKITAPVSY